MLNWLAEDENLITIQPRARVDSELKLTQASLGAIAMGFLVVLPAAFLFAGGMIWWRRRRRADEARPGHEARLDRQHAAARRGRRPRLYVIYRPAADEGPSTSSTTLAASAVKRMLIEPRDGEPIELEKRGEAWYLVRPFQARADRSQVDRMLELTAPQQQGEARGHRPRALRPGRTGAQGHAGSSASPSARSTRSTGAVRPGRRRRVPAAFFLLVAGAAEGRRDCSRTPCSSKARNRSRSSWRLPHRAARPEMGALAGRRAGTSPARTTSTAGWTGGASPPACSRSAPAPAAGRAHQVRSAMAARSSWVSCRSSPS